MRKRQITILLVILSLAIFGFTYATLREPLFLTAEDLKLDEQEATIRAIKKVIPSVVSIIVYDYEEVVTVDLETGQESIEKEKKEIGSGTGFLISSDGLILTNKHVINIAAKDTGEYRIILGSDKQYYAQFIGSDPLNDAAVLKIFDKNLPAVEIGDSDKLQIGSSVIAIGNALGQYQNTATKGIVSGLGRNIIASDQDGNAESLDNVIQTDAEINFGNSGGPLIDLNGKVIGINTAIDEEGTSIGFAIPINDIRQVINSILKSGRIIRPYLGVRYIMITPEIVQDQQLLRNEGALITVSGDGDAAIIPNSPAQKSGLEEGDIIFEINGIKVEGKTTLLSLIQRFKVGDKIGLKLQRGKKILIKIITLEEFK